MTNRKSPTVLRREKAFAKAELAALTVTRVGALISGKPVEVRNA